MQWTLCDDSSLNAAVGMVCAGAMLLCALSNPPQDTVKKYPVSCTIVSQKLHKVRDHHSER
jgi:hypothetical protein